AAAASVRSAAGVRAAAERPLREARQRRQDRVDPVLSAHCILRNRRYMNSRRRADRFAGIRI
ncbi:hypothetical protein, partial [Burkholderia multivorans]|uniref:hypothetical protein n=1 Tax=Burkholderia multivorans TaxID=87883 RepID=UPI001B909299